MRVQLLSRRERLSGQSVLQTVAGQTVAGMHSAEQQYGRQQAVQVL